MNNSINYSGFVEMFLDSGDEFEPYGCVDTPSPAGDAQRNKRDSASQQQEHPVEEPWGE